LDGHGQGHPTNGDGTYELAMEEGSTVQDVIRSMGVPFDQVAMIRINGRQCQVEADVKAGDRIALIPPDVAAFWRYVGLQNLGMDGVVDF
jgi:molybdopterin converting factor small subunit